MRAIILAAGKGERLHPYTSDRPKCLVELAGRALLTVLLLAPLAFLMGTPFPLGLRSLAGVGVEGVAWGWGSGNGVAKRGYEQTRLSEL